MNSVLNVRLTNRRHGRLLLYGPAVLIALTLCFIYLRAKRPSEAMWPTDANWLRDLYAIDSPEDLRSALTIINLSFMNGRLSALCALKNMDPEHGVVLQVATDGEGRFWSRATLEASGSPSGPWNKVGVTGDSRSGESKVLRPGDAITFNVALDDYRAVVEKYRYGRIVTPSGETATFSFDVLRPPPMYVPTREEIRQEREHEVVLTPGG